MNRKYTLVLVYSRGNLSARLNQQETLCIVVVYRTRANYRSVGLDVAVPNRLLMVIKRQQHLNEIGRKFQTTIDYKMSAMIEFVTAICNLNGHLSCAYWAVSEFFFSFCCFFFSFWFIPIDFYTSFYVPPVCQCSRRPKRAFPSFSSQYTNTHYKLWWNWISMVKCDPHRCFTAHTVEIINWVNSTHGAGGHRIMETDNAWHNTQTHIRTIAIGTNLIVRYLDE